MIECLLPGNHFNGSIPSTMGNMTDLWHLNLANNAFSGKIPQSLGSIPMLQVADFSGNQLLGLQEGIVFKSKSLEVLNLAENKQLILTFNTLLEAMEPINQSLRILNISNCNFLGKKNRKVTLGVFYRPPNNDPKPLEDLQAVLQEFSTKELILVGEARRHG